MIRVKMNKGIILVLFTVVTLTLVNANPAAATNYYVREPWCVANGGVWTAPTFKCTLLANVAIAFGDMLITYPYTTLDIDSSVILNINGGMYAEGHIFNLVGSININAGGTFTNNGTIDNFGYIDNYGTAGYYTYSDNSASKDNGTTGNYSSTKTGEEGHLRADGNTINNIDIGTRSQCLGKKED